MSDTNNSEESKIVSNLTDTCNTCAKCDRCSKCLFNEDTEESCTNENGFCKCPREHFSYHHGKEFPEPIEPYSVINRNIIEELGTENENYVSRWRVHTVDGWVDQSEEISYQVTNLKITDPTGQYYLTVSIPSKSSLHFVTKDAIATVFNTDNLKLFDTICSRYHSSAVPLFVVHNKQVYLFNNNQYGSSLIYNMNGDILSQQLILDHSKQREELYEEMNKHPGYYNGGFTIDMEQIDDNIVIFNGWAWHPVFYQVYIDIAKSIANKYITKHTVQYDERYGKVDLDW